MSPVPSLATFSCASSPLFVRSKLETRAHLQTVAAEAAEAEAVVAKAYPSRGRIPASFLLSPRDKNKQEKVPGRQPARPLTLLPLWLLPTSAMTISLPPLLDSSYYNTIAAVATGRVRPLLNFVGKAGEEGEHTGTTKGVVYLRSPE